MRKILRFVKREYLAAVKTKGFIIMLLLMPVLMGGSGIAMMLLKDKVDTTDKKVAVVDRSGILSDLIMEAAPLRNDQAVYDKKSGKKLQPAYLFEIVPPDNTNPERQRLELSDLIRKGDLHAFLDIGPDVLNPLGAETNHAMTYHSSGAAIDEVRNWLNNLINTHLRKVRLTEFGVDDAAADQILFWIQVDPMGLLTMDEATGEINKAKRTDEAQAILGPVVVFFLMFMMVMMGAMPLLQSTMEEKGMRIAEVLLGSLTPFQFMAGKVLGGLAVSLTGASVYVFGGVFFMGRLGLSDYIPYHVIPWFFTFLVLEIVMVGSMLAALGSACNDPKDAQNMTFPAMIPVFFPMFIFMPVIMSPNAGFATTLSLVPPFTPMLMLLRLAAPESIPAWQPWVGLVGVIAFTVLAVWAGGRIFRVGILMQGGAPKLSNLLRWTLKG